MFILALITARKIGTLYMTYTVSMWSGLGAQRGTDYDHSHQAAVHSGPFTVKPESQNHLSWISPGMIFKYWYILMKTFSLFMPNRLLTNTLSVFILSY